MRLISNLLITTFFLLAGHAIAEVHPSPLAGWRTLQSERFSVQYAPPDRELAVKALAIAEQVLPQIERFLQWQTRTHIYINLVDVQDAPNGWATMLPYNHVTLYTTPPTQFSELGDYNRWMRLLIAHELTHIVHLDKGGGTALGLRRVFGRFPLLFPNAYQPGLFTEGLATWVETDRRNGFGRGQGAWYRAMMRIEVESGLLSLGEVQQARSEWPLNHAYLYGVHFYEFLESVYGRDRIPEYIGDYSANLIPFLLSTPSRRVANKRIDALWQDYLAWLAQRYRPEIDALRSAGITPAQQLTHRGYITGRPVAFAPDRLAWVDVGLDEPSYIVSRGSDGVEYRLTRAQADARLVGVAGKYLYFLQDAPCGERRVFSELFRVDVDATVASSMRAYALGNGLALDRATQLTRCQRYTHAALSGDGERIAVVQSLTGRQQLLVRALAGGDAAVVWQGGFDDQVAQPAWLDAQTLVVSLKRADTKWQLHRVDIASGTVTRMDVALPRGNQLQPFFDVATQRLYFTADHAGVFDIYRSDRDGLGVVRMTRSLGGSADAWVARGQLFHVGYTAQGWDIFSADASAPPATDTALPAYTAGRSGNARQDAGMHLAWPPEDTLAAPTVARDKGYRSFPALLPRSWFLGGFSTGDAQELGALVNGSDPLGFHNYVAGVAHEFGIERTSGMIEYLAYNHLQLGYQRNYDIDGNGFDPADPAFRIDRYQLREDTTATLFTTLPMNFSNVTAYAGLNDSRDRYYDIRSGAALVQEDIDVHTLGAGFLYESSQRFLHGVSESHGRRIKAGLERDTLAARNVFAAGGAAATGRSAGDVASFDWREYLALGHRHVLALRGFSGRGDAGSDYFRLGDNFSMLQFSMPFVHDRAVALRGYPDGLRELRDVNAELFSAEWRIPLPAINRGISGIPLGAHTAYATAFYDAGKAWGTAPNPVRRADAAVFDSAGVEAVMIVDLGYSLLPMQFRLGYAQPLVDHPQVSTHTVYLTAGAAF